MLHAVSISLKIKPTYAQNAYIIEIDTVAVDKRCRTDISVAYSQA